MASHTPLYACFHFLCANAHAPPKNRRIFHFCGAPRSEYVSIQTKHRLSEYYIVCVALRSRDRVILNIIVPTQPHPIKARAVNALWRHQHLLRLSTFPYTTGPSPALPLLPSGRVLSISRIPLPDPSPTARSLPSRTSGRFLPLARTPPSPLLTAPPPSSSADPIVQPTTSPPTRLPSSPSPTRVLLPPPTPMPLLHTPAPARHPSRPALAPGAPLQPSTSSRA